MDKDYYNILGVSKSASDEEIKSAYRKLSKQFHPDMFAHASESEKKAAEEKFKDINAAYSVLKDKEKRANYDNYGSPDGPQGFGGGGFGGGFNGYGDDVMSSIFDIFTSGFGSSMGGNRQNIPRDGTDIKIPLTLDLTEAAFGCEKEIPFERVERCKECSGTGAKNGTQYKTCTKCGGKGSYTAVQNSILGRVNVTKTCEVCGGSGRIVIENCKMCSGKGYVKQTRKLKVKIPAGVDNDNTITYRGEGNLGSNGGSNGNAVIFIRVKEHPIFKRRNADLFIDVPVSFTQAALGCTLEVPTLNGKTTLKISEATQTGTVFKIKGKGIKYLKREAFGDLNVTITVETPKSLTRAQKEYLKNLEKDSHASQYPNCKKFRDLNN